MLSNLSLIPMDSPGTRRKQDEGGRKVSSGKNTSDGKSEKKAINKKNKTHTRTTNDAAEGQSKSNERRCFLVPDKPSREVITFLISVIVDC